MDGYLGIDSNRRALVRIVVALIAMAGIDTSRATLPRRLRNAVLRLLRPAEAAARRLAIALAHGLFVTLPPRRGRTSKTPLRMKSRPRPCTLPLLDPPCRPFAPRRSYVPAHRGPRISVPGISDPVALPPKPSPDDELDAARLRLRLQALAAALDDLPKQAQRFARWQARQGRDGRVVDAAKTPRLSGPAWKAVARPPLRRPRSPRSRGTCRHEVHGILAHADELARFALSRADTS
ncbi:MAG: hypothetical protein KF914_09790 [Rhizobiaceae bacterium]|nr:hypothetical protein [Rhizobiaceae bacterium]